MYPKSQTDHLCIGSEGGLYKRKMEFVKRCKVLKLRDDGTAGVFKERVQTRAALVVEKPTGVEKYGRISRKL